MGRAFKYTQSRRSEARRLIEGILQRLPELSPGIVYTIIGVLASVENVFPPVPADTAVALGAFLSAHGSVSAWSVFGVTWAANVGSGIGVYVAARTLGRKFFTGRIGSRLLNPRHLGHLEQLYERYGTLGIFLSRFVPGARALIPPFAGIARLGAVKALIPLALASAIWYGALTFTAANLIPKLDDVARFVIGLNWVGLVLAILVVAGPAWYLIRRGKNQGKENIQTGGQRP